MTATLTERYVAETLRGIRPENHEDVRAELLASIADAVEARVEQGEAPDDAERAALNELGDPAWLAAGLSDRPLQLIGPRYYLQWLRVLKVLLAIVPACLAVVAGLAAAVEGLAGAKVFAEAISGGLTGALHVFFWTTLAAAVAERTAVAGGRNWTIDSLPVARRGRRGAGDLIATAIVLVVAAIGFWWDRSIGWIVLDGTVVPIFAPELWPWWMTALFILFALIVLLQAAVLIRGHWTSALALTGTALHVIGLSWFLTLLGRGNLFSTALIEAVVERTAATDTALLVVAAVIGLAGTAIAAGGIADCWIKRARDSREA